MTKHHRSHPPVPDAPAPGRTVPGRAATTAPAAGATNPPSDETAHGEHDWVAGVLRAAAEPRIPADVDARILAALEREQRHREIADIPDTADPDELVALRNRTNRGTFGANMPSALTKRALGIGRRD